MAKLSLLSMASHAEVPGFLMGSILVVSLGGFVSPLLLKIVIVGWQLVVSEIVIIITHLGGNL